MVSPSTLRILTLTGASGVGKTTLARLILESLSDSRLVTSVTTRSSRPSDLPGEYEHVSPEEFEEREQAGQFLWTAHMPAARYGTQYHSVKQAMAAPPWSLMILVPQRLKTLHQLSPSGVLSLHLVSPGPEEMRRRLLARGDLPESVESRIAECLEWDRKVRESGVPVVPVLSEADYRELLLRLARS